MNTVLITYLVVANERPLDAIQPTEALVWKKELELTDIDVSIKPDPDWCYERIIQANPDFANYTIAIWGVDIETV
ncbi:MAG: hypothetical protein LDL41_19340 [Coleofasciculus sp. S288]|nr:hypothetical protein [Coleofasciculus sp. S288]